MASEVDIRGVICDSNCARITMADKERSFQSFKISGKTNKMRVGVIGRRTPVGATVGNDEEDLTCSMLVFDANKLREDVKAANGGDWSNSFFGCVVEVTPPGGVSIYKEYVLTPLETEGVDLKANDAGALVETMKFFAFGSSDNV